MQTTDSASLELKPLEVLQEVEPHFYAYGTTKYKCRRVLCRCACGKTFITNMSKVRTGKVQSCGCLRGRAANGTYKKRAPFSVKLRGDPVIAYTNQLLKQYAKDAKKRNLTFNLTHVEFYDLVTRPCHYCGATPRFHKRSGPYVGPFAWNGLDRRDNLADYTKENTVPCCPRCNSFKSKLSEPKFLALITHIFKHRHLGSVPTMPEPIRNL